MSSYTDALREGAAGSSVTVEFPDPISAMIDNLEENAIDTIMVIMEDALQGIIENAKANWLVRKKKSKGSIDKFELSIEPMNNKLRGTIRNNAEYAYMIRVGRNSRNRSGVPTELRAGFNLWDELVAAPLINASDSIQEKITEAIENLQEDIPF